MDVQKGEKDHKEVAKQSYQEKENNENKKKHAKSWKGEQPQ